MTTVLQLLLEGERLDTVQLASILNQSEAEVSAELERLQAEQVLLGWRPVFNPERAEGELVRAVIEVRISPERDGGFDRLAARISQFEAVESCYLMSGAYDLLLFAKGKDLREVATFVSERLASVEGCCRRRRISCCAPTRSRGIFCYHPLRAAINPPLVRNV